MNIFVHSKSVVNSTVFALLASVVVVRDLSQLAFVILFLLGGFAIFARPKLVRQRIVRFWLVAVLGFFISSSISLIVADVPTIEWRVLDVPSRFLLIIPVFILFLKVEVDTDTVWMGAAIGATTAGVLAYYQHFDLNLQYARGAANHHIVFGCVSLTMAMLSLMGLIDKRDQPVIWRSILVAGVMGGLVAALYSSARGSWVALPAVLLFLTWIFRARLGLWRITGVFGLALIAAVALYLIDGSGVSKRVDAAVSDVRNYYLEGNHSSSVGARLEMFKASWLIFSENPWLGTGPDSYIRESNKLEQAGIVRPLSDELAHPHNEYLNVMYSRGLLGLGVLLMIYLGPLVYFFAEFRRSRTTLALAGSVVPLCYLVFSLSEAVLDRMLSLMFYLIIMSLLIALYLRQNQHDASQESTR
jgi:O-antigen ligase